MVPISPQVAISLSLYNYDCNLPRLPSDWSTLTSRLSSLAGTPSAQLTLQPPPLYRVSLLSYLVRATSLLPHAQPGWDPSSWHGPPSFITQPTGRFYTHCTGCQTQPRRRLLAPSSCCTGPTSDASLTASCYLPSAQLSPARHADPPSASTGQLRKLQNQSNPY